MPCLPEELRRVEECVTQRLGIPALQPQTDSDMGISGHNHIQLCGGAEGVARPHVDSAAICDYAAVLVPSPQSPDPSCGNVILPASHAGRRTRRQRLPAGI